MLEAHGLAVNQDGARRSAFELAAQPQFPIAALARVWPAFATIPAGLVPRLEADAKYAVYLDRQADDVARYRREDAMALPDDLDYARISGLSDELRQKFIAVRPRSLGQAGRIEGVTPAALALVAAHARRVGPARRPAPLDRSGVSSRASRPGDDLASASPEGPRRRLAPRPCFT